MNKQTNTEYQKINWNDTTWGKWITAGLYVRCWPSAFSFSQYDLSYLSPVYIVIPHESHIWLTFHISPPVTQWQLDWKVNLKRYSMGSSQLTSVLSVGYLTVFSVQQLKALYVLQFDALWQRLPLEVDVSELWQSSGRICNTEKQEIRVKWQQMQGVISTTCT